MFPGYALLAALCAWGCEGGGSLTLELDLPAEESLSPVAGDRLAELTLVTWGPDNLRQSETRPVTERGAALHMGELEPGSEINVALELRSRTGRLIGYGRSHQPVVVRGGQAQRVPLAVRRPFVYVPGGGEVNPDQMGEPRRPPPTLATLDASVDPSGEAGAGGADYRGSISVSLAPTAAASSFDGRDLVVAGEAGGAGRLLLVSTSSHQERDLAAVPLSPQPTDVALSPNGLYAAVSHGGSGGGVSVVDLERVRAGDPEGAVEFVELGPVGAICASSGPEPGGPARAFALVDRARTLDCQAAPASRVVTLSLDSPAELGVTIDHGGPIHDIGVPADGSAILAADACQNGVFRLSPDDGASEKLLELEAASAVAALEGRAWAAGTLQAKDGGAPRVSLASVELDGGEETRFDLPEAIASALFQEDDYEQDFEQKLAADSLRVTELAAAPGGSQVALVAEGRFHADEVVLDGVIPTFPPIDITTYDYFLVDAGSGGITQRVRTLCEIEEQNPEAYVFFGWECSPSADQDTLPRAEEYVPLGLAVLYGAR